jgi:hypothetical protein
MVMAWCFNCFHYFGVIDLFYSVSSVRTPSELIGHRLALTLTCATDE